MTINKLKEYPVAITEVITKPILTINEELLISHPHIIPIEIRMSGCFRDRGFYLNRYDYDWQLVLDKEGGELILLPTKREELEGKGK